MKRLETKISDEKVIKMNYVTFHKLQSVQESVTLQDFYQVSINSKG